MGNKREPWKPGDIDTWRAPIVCSQPECKTEMPSHAWAVIQTEGWFHQKDGNSWCPEHIPEWVANWRAKKAERKRGK